MEEKEELGLSLSLCSSSDLSPLQLTLIHPKTQLIDVNRSDGEAEEEAEAWSPISTLSSLSGKSRERGEEEADNSRSKKLWLSKQQTAVLEDSFKEQSTLNPKQKLALAKRLNLRPRQVEVWFQNRRARTKLKQTEVECDYLKRWCRKLAEENRRLHKEVAELRALKSVVVSPQFHHMNESPPITLTICPSCERITASSSNSTTTSTSSSLPPQLLPGHHPNHHCHHLFPMAAHPNPWASHLPQAF